jgi:CheY-like chemotaxis protein
MEKSYKVFYIEDNVDNGILVQRFLSFEGFEVLLAETGQEGLNKATEFLPDIFLIDLNLPDMSGYDVIKHLTNQIETRHIPKVVFSADGAHLAKETLPAGPVFFMEKPVDVDKLADKIRFAIHCPDNSQKLIL